LQAADPARGMRWTRNYPSHAEWVDHAIFGAASHSEPSRAGSFWAPTQPKAPPNEKHSDRAAS